MELLQQIQNIQNLDLKNEIVIYGFGVLLFFLTLLITLIRHNEEMEIYRSKIRNQHIDHDNINFEFDSSTVTL